MNHKAQPDPRISDAVGGRRNPQASAAGGYPLGTFDQSEAGNANLARVPVSVLRLDAEAVVTDVSDRCLSLLGYRRHEVVRRHLSEFQDRRSAQQTAADWDILLTGGEINDGERKFLRHDGSLIAVAMSAAVQSKPWDREFVVLMALTDITACKRAEAALEASQAGLRHAQKMEAVGQLTGGIAHDFNNLLQAVGGNLELICSRVADDQVEVMRLADNALGATQKAATLTSQLLAFARSHQPELMPIAPMEAVKGIRDLLARAAGERITLCLDETTDDVGACLADLNQLECALLNLVINARDAIGGAAGTIRISVRAEQINAAPAGCLAKGRYLRIAVRDDGPGMSDEVCRRAFEPFFTTKGMGKGSGLGLAQIQGFAQQLGGMAFIESAAGKGTEVAILLPSTSQPVSRPSQPPLPTAGAGIGEGETVLVVDDDALVRSTLADTLCDLGYQVVEADDADAALTMLEGGVAADLIVTDLSMPGSMNGFEFAVTARRRFVDLPVILTTGHLGILSDSPLPSGVTFVKKPFSRAEVAAAIRHALDEAC